MRAFGLMLFLCLSIPAAFAGVVDESIWYHQHYIEPGRLTDLTQFSEASAISNAGLQYGKLGDANVFIKVVANEKDFMNEASYTRRLYEARIGPRLYGATKTKNGYAMVTEKIEGVNLRFQQEFVKNMPLYNQDTVASLERITRYIEAHPTVFFHDLQMRMNAETGRVYVIDAGQFHSSIHSREANQEALEKVRKLKSFVEFSLRYQKNPVLNVPAQRLYDYLLPLAKNKEHAKKTLPGLLSYYVNSSQLHLLSDTEAVNFLPLVYQATRRDPESAGARLKKLVGGNPENFVPGAKAEFESQKLLLELNQVLEKTNSPLLQDEKFKRWWRQIAPKAQARMEDAARFARLPIAGNCLWFFHKLAGKGY